MSEQINDGGPAFPMPSGNEPRASITTHYNEGMSLRDWFAGMALQGWLASFGPDQGHPVNNNIQDAAANEAYLMADAMLKAREAAK